MTGKEFCLNVTHIYPIGYTGNGVVMIVLAATYLIMSISQIYFIKLQEYRAAREYKYSGNSDQSNAVKSKIFPVFVMVLWANVLVNVYIFFMGLTFPFDRENASIGSSWAFSIMSVLFVLIK